MADVVQYAGDDETGDPLFDMPLPLPDPLEFDPPPTPRMKTAISDLFGDGVELTGSQAHVVLSCRDYGRQCAARLLDRYPRPIRDLFGKLVMIYVLADAGRLADVIAWSNRRFDRQPDSSAIGRTKRFPEVERWLSGLLAECRARGAAFTGGMG